ncbi:MAG: PorT family protein [Cyclobacteriaceae bacterium]|nr:PorT family protein [Cyclobacteriaceae bacterium]
MKKIILSFALLTLAFGAFAQGISGGIKGGLNLANQNYDVEGFTISPDNRTSFHLGGYLNVGFSESFSLQPELLFNSVGAKYTGDGDYLMKLNYISVPVMFKYNPAPIFNIHAGPQFGFLMSAKGESDGDSEDIKDDLKGLDFGFGLGAGVDLPMGLNFSARYILGLSNIVDELDSSDGKVTNNVIQLSIGYRLFGGK